MVGVPKREVRLRHFIYVPATLGMIAVEVEFGVTVCSAETFYGQEVARGAMSSQP